MREVGAYEAKTHLPKLLDAVENGETIVITRHGRPVARLEPAARPRAEVVKAAFAEIARLRKGVQGASVEEILAWRDEGRRY